MLLPAQLRSPFAALCLLLITLSLAQRAVAQDSIEWSGLFPRAPAQVDRQTPGQLGVYVKRHADRHLGSYHGEDARYPASTVKVPIAIAVMRRVEQDDLTLDSPVTLLASDYVDGAGPTNSHAPGKALSVRYLLDQMLIHSDNTASDMLIRLVGIAGQCGHPRAGA